MSDGSVTYLKYRARDQAGNISSVISQTYTVDTQVATITVNSYSDKIRSGSATLGWQSSRNGNYSILIGGTDCTNGTAATGTNISGSANASTPISTSINNVNLNEGSNTIRICVANLIGNYGSTTRTIVKDVTAPTISITNPTVSTPIASNSQLTLSGSDTGGTGIQKYAYTADGNDPTFSGTDCSIGTGTLYTSSVSLANGNYSIKARSCDNVGNVSTVASLLVSVGPPGAPSIASASAGNEKVTINFGTVSGATSYKVYYQTSSGVTTSDSSVSGTSSPIEVTGLTNSTTYFFAITASHGGGESALSGVSSSTPIAAPRTPFISEYMEGSSNNKAIEIYAPDAFDLSTCRVDLYINGQTTASTNPIILNSVQLAAGGTYVVCNSGIAPAIQNQCSQLSSFVVYNGDDAFTLSCGGTILDIFGKIGERPQIGYWSGVNGLSRDNTLRRNCSVLTGVIDTNANFNIDNEWLGFPMDTYSDLGQRSCP
jgi:hypothetical protein